MIINRFPRRFTVLGVGWNCIRGLVCCILVIVLFVHQAAAQINLLGKPGYIKVPSANWESTPTFSLSATYLPVENTLNTSSFFDYDGIYYGARVGVTKYLEVGLNVTYHLEKERIGIGDRQVDVRLKLLQESEKWPGIALILSLPLESNNLISYNALSLTKKFTLLGTTTLELTGGYGLPYYLGIPYQGSLGFYSKKEIGNVYLNGFFGGFSWKPVSWAGIMFDYDTRDLNAGLWIGYKDRIGLQYHLYGLKNSGGNVYFKVPLGFESRELRRYRKSLSKGGI